MGLDLMFLPFDGDNNNLCFSHTIPNCFRRKELFNEILALQHSKGRPVAKNFKSYLSWQAEGENYQFSEITTTPYGKLINFLLASDLLEFTEKRAEAPGFRRGEVSD